MKIIKIDRYVRKYQKDFMELKRQGTKGTKQNIIPGLWY